MNAGERDEHQAQHPYHVQQQHGGPAKRGEFCHAQHSGITLTRDLFDPEVALAHDQLPDLEGEEQRREEEQGDHRGQGSRVLGWAPRVNQEESAGRLREPGIALG